MPKKTYQACSLCSLEVPLNKLKRYNDNIYCPKCYRLAKKGVALTKDGVLPYSDKWRYPGGWI
ncbi:TPA: hypothetical protein HA317_04040 [Candidatus Woesearchaeota archaeon]|nr:hypothetical protein [Candidatus Woesearchaeota archaeon]